MMNGDPASRSFPPARKSGPPDDRTIIGAQAETDGRDLGATLSPPGRLGGGHEWIGRTFGRYRITGLLGGGGMGVVYRARDEVIEREVAVKVLPPELAADALALDRFLSEAKAAGRLSHPNAVALYEVGEDEGVHFLIMELVTGGSLAEEVRRIGPLSPVAATRAAAEAARGLAAAHAAGLVHRDVKPANLLRAADGTVKVCDFGLAKGDTGDRNLTRYGQVVGTPYYMSPEQCEAKPADARSDVYSLGATYYFLLTGNDPYAEAGSTVRVMYAHLHEDPLDPAAFDHLIPDPCAAIVRKATAKAPADRYPTAAEMLRDLEAAQNSLSGGRSGPQARLSPSGMRSAVSGPASRSSRSNVAAAPRRRGLIAAGGLIIALVAAAGLWFAFGGRAPADRSAAAASAGPSTSAPTDGKSPTPSVSPADGGGGGAASAVPAGEPIRVGVLHSLTGPMADSESPVVDAVLFAIDEVNRTGGVLGRPVEAVVADGRSDPAVFLREAERLIDVEKVPVVFGCWTSDSRKTVVPLFEDRDHLLVYPVQHEGLEESPNVLYTGAAPNQQILPALEWAVKSLGAKRIFFVGSDYVFPHAAAAIVRDAAPDLGVEIVGEEYLPLTARTAGAVVPQIAASKPDVVINAINGDANLIFFNSLRRAGVRPEDVPTISLCIGEEGLRRMDTASVAGDYAAWNYFATIESPENVKFVTAFRTKYGPQRVVTDPMEAAYVGVRLWANAANEAGSIETRRVRSALRSQRLDAPEGPVRVDAESQHLFKTPRIGRIDEDGRFAVIWSSEGSVRPEPYPPTRSAEQWKAFLSDLHRGWDGHWSPPQ